MSNVLISVPTRGQMCWQTVTRLEQIRDDRPGLPPILYEPGHLSIAATRNQIVGKFMVSDCDVLVMVDDDVVPPPHFLDVTEYLPEYGMVGVPCPLWFPEPGFHLNVYRFDDDQALRLFDCDPGINDVDALGTGCVAVHRTVFERLGSSPFRFEQPGVSEDFVFCADLRKHDLRIGCFWDGWYADHIRAMSMAPLMEARLHA